MSPSATCSESRVGACLGARGGFSRLSSRARPDGVAVDREQGICRLVPAFIYDGSRQDEVWRDYMTTDAHLVPVMQFCCHCHYGCPELLFTPDAPARRPVLLDRRRRPRGA